MHISLSNLVAMVILRSSENQATPFMILIPYSENPGLSSSPLSQVHAPVIHPLTCFAWFSVEKNHVAF